MLDLTETNRQVARANDIVPFVTPAISSGDVLEV
jgi:hypothetical protein